MIAKSRHYINRFKYHKTHRMLPEIPGGSGACGQDLLVADLLENKRDGVFVDIGANDGLTISNTRYLEKELGWSGIAVEPIPSVFETLKANRNCTLVNGCVTTESGMGRFFEVVGGPHMLSTLAIHNIGLTARRLRKNAVRQNAKIREIDVRCFTFAELAEKHGVREIDFLSVHTEGGELEILKSIDFSRFPTKVVSVENNYYTPEIRSHLESQGFFYLGTFKVDEIYLHGGNHFSRNVNGNVK